MIPEISVAQLHRMQEDKEPIFLIDVRRNDEWNIAHIRGATHIPLHELPAQVPHVAEVLGERKVIVYCHHGRRSAIAADILRSAGVEAYSLAGGIDAWALEIDPTLRRY